MLATSGEKEFHGEKGKWTSFLEFLAMDAYSELPVSPLPLGRGAYFRFMRSRIQAKFTSEALLKIF